jgi:hypothetical protein
MKARNANVLFALWVIALVGCATAKEQPEEVMNKDAFNAYFADQRACAGYVDELVRPTAKVLSAVSTIADMRQALERNHDDRFAALVIEVQRRSAVIDPVDPARETDQLKLARYLDEQMSSLPDFTASRCGTDTREAVMESLYLGIGGEASPVAAQLRRNGATGSWSQRWMLLASLLAHEIAPNALK